MFLLYSEPVKQLFWLVPTVGLCNHIYTWQINHISALRASRAIALHVNLRPKLVSDPALQILREEQDIRWQITITSPERTEKSTVSERTYRIYSWILVYLKTFLIFISSLH